MLKVNELFSGIGAFRKALINLGVEHEVVGIAEIDKYAIRSYEAMYGPVHNYGDISKSLKLDYADMWTYGFPCQDISVAGKQAGIERHTRSGLLYQVQRLLEVAYQYDELPKYLILENVKNLVGKKFRADFDEWLNYLNELGYNNYWKVLNAKNYGVPQNRERVFVVSIRKDIDTGYEFPMPFDNGIRLKDVLEDEVDEKFYISNEKVEKLISQLDKNGFDFKGSTITVSKQATETATETALCLLARDYKGFGNQEMNAVLQTDKPVRIGNIYGEDKGTGFAGNVWERDAISPTLTTMQGGNREPMVMLKTSCNQAIADLIKENNRIAPHQQDLLQHEDDIARCLPAGTHGSTPHLTKTIVRDGFNYRIRKLTPKECWRLMGFSDDDFQKCVDAGISNSQLYKQAGNSIVVDVLFYMLKNLLGE